MKIFGNLQWFEGAVQKANVLVAGNLAINSGICGVDTNRFVEYKLTLAGSLTYAYLILTGYVV